MSALSALMSAMREIEKKAREQAQVERLEARSSEQLETLEEHFRIKVLQVLSILQRAGWKPVVFWGVRTTEQQTKLFQQGVGAKKSLHVEGTRKIVHRAGWTYLQTGEAADIVDARYLWEGPAKNLDYEFWKQLGQAAEAHGLEWGGRWANRDVAHVQCTHHEWAPQKNELRKKGVPDSRPVGSDRGSIA